jgi:predicted nucleic acid-binding protein
MAPAILDTDIPSEVLKQRNPIVCQRASLYLQHHGRFALSAVTRFEMASGYKELTAATQLKKFANFCAHSLILIR